MKEQLISFDTAKLAKEKGFDVPVKRSYQLSLTESVHPEDGTSGPFGWEKGELSLQDGYFINNWEDSDFTNDSWYHCAAPTQSLLQKWLREEHNIHIQVYVMETWLNTGNEMEVYFEVNLKITNNLKGLSNVKSNMLQFKTYEEALEKGLQEALKL